MNSILHQRRERAARPTGKPPRQTSRAAGLRKWLIGGLLLAVIVGGGMLAIAWRWAEVRYDAHPAMRVPLASAASDTVYQQRRLLLLRRDATHYDFVLEPTSDRVARVVLSNIDISALAPQVNATGYGAGEREQLWLAAGDERVEIRGGDGFEAQHLASVAIASNHGHASGWQVSLSAEVGGAPAIYYRGDFHFPLGHYRDLFEQVTGLDYADYRRELEAETPLVASDAGESTLR